jgi:colicin import membrane protein
MAAEQEVHQEPRKVSAQEVARQVERYTKVRAERDEANNDAAKAREEIKGYECKFPCIV